MGLALNYSSQPPAACWPRGIWPWTSPSPWARLKCLQVSKMVQSMLNVSHNSEPILYLWLCKVSANERRHYMCNVFSHWPRPCIVIDRKLMILWYYRSFIYRSPIWHAISHRRATTWIKDTSDYGLTKDTPYLILNYIDIIMTMMASQITSLTVVYSIVYSGSDQRTHQSSPSLAFVRGIHRDRGIPRTKGQLRGKCFHLMTSTCKRHPIPHPNRQAMGYLLLVLFRKKWSQYFRSALCHINVPTGKFTIKG